MPEAKAPRPHALARRGDHGDERHEQRRRQGHTRLRLDEAFEWHRTQHKRPDDDAQHGLEHYRCQAHAARNFRHHWHCYCGKHQPEDCRVHGQGGYSSTCQGRSQTCGLG